MSEGNTRGSDVSERKRPFNWRKLAPACALLVIVAAIAVAMLMSPQTSEAGSPVMRVTKLAEHPHDQQAFTQGLAIHGGDLIEGTGRYRQSSLRRVNVASGEVTQHVRLDDQIFGEGVAVWNDVIIQLTWKRGFLIVYDAATLERQQTVNYRDIDRSIREGWGITYDGRHLVISDGSSVLRFVDPETWKLVRRVRVRDGIRSVRKLNELEYVNGEILANVWYSSRIARINPESGAVIGWLELKNLFPRSIRRNREAVLNGIAWDANTQRLYVTGKLWPALFEVTFDGLPARLESQPR